MRLHDRYFLRELITPLAVCLGAFIVFWLSMFFSQELEPIRDAKLHFTDIVEFALAKMPEILVLVLPFILLFGMLRALTQHARHNEITALRAAGVSLWRICLPYFLVGLLTAGVYFALNEIVVPACAQWSDEILNRYVKKAAAPRAKTIFTNVGFRNNREHRLWKMGEYNANTQSILNPTVIWYEPNGLQHQLKADRGTYTNGTWVFFNVGQFAKTNLDGALLQLPETDELAMPQFGETPDSILRDLKFNDAQGTLSKRNADIPLSELWPYLRQNPDISTRESAQLYTKFHARLAAPWTCFIVVLMAIPFGAQSGRRNLFYGVAGSIFVCFSFFVLQQVSLAFGLGGQMPPWVAAWLPNIIFAAVGFFLTLRVR
jgi:lipopolysaccharide export system permease protein